LAFDTRENTWRLDEPREGIRKQDLGPLRHGA
jgi:hypothetical protein